MSIAHMLETNIPAFTRPNSWSDAATLLRKFAKRHKLTNVAHLTMTPDHQRGGGATFITTYSKEWIERYLTQNYAAIDPVLPRARASLVPFEWSTLWDKSAEVRAFFEDSWAMGVGRHGVTVPIRGGGGELAVFSVTSDDSDEVWAARTRELLPFLQIFAAEFNRGLAGLVGLPPFCVEVSSRLTRRERDVLHWAAAGKTVWETSVLLGIQEQTTQGYIRDAIRRLGCLNKTHAVAEAVRQGVI